LMPHRHSAASQEARHLRAGRLGFLAPRPSGCRWLLVPERLHPRLRSMASSVQLHSEHDALVGRSSHFARFATLAAAPLVGDVATRRALDIHRSANRAKHSWGRSLGEEVGPVDPFVLADPWASCRRTSPPSSGGSSAASATRSSATAASSAFSAGSFAEASSTASAVGGEPAQMCLCFGTVEECTKFARSMGLGPQSPRPLAPVEGVAVVVAGFPKAAGEEVHSGKSLCQVSEVGVSSIVGLLKGGDYQQQGTPSIVGLMESGDSQQLAASSSQQLAAPPCFKFHSEAGEVFIDPWAKQVCIGKGKGSDKFKGKPKDKEEHVQKRALKRVSTEASTEAASAEEAITEAPARAIAAAGGAVAAPIEEFLPADLATKKVAADAAAAVGPMEMEAFAAEEATADAPTDRWQVKQACTAEGAARAIAAAGGAVAAPMEEFSPAIRATKQVAADYAAADCPMVMEVFATEEASPEVPTEKWQVKQACTAEVAAAEAVAEAPAEDEAAAYGPVEAVAAEEATAEAPTAAGGAAEAPRSLYRRLGPPRRWQQRWSWLQTLLSSMRHGLLRQGCRRRCSPRCSPRCCLGHFAPDGEEEGEPAPRLSCPEAEEERPPRLSDLIAVG